jgi:hypothetical protein
MIAPEKNRDDLVAEALEVFRDAAEASKIRGG